MKVLIVHDSGELFAQHEFSKRTLIPWRSIAHEATTTPIIIGHDQPGHQECVDFMRDLRAATYAEQSEPY